MTWFDHLTLMSLSTHCMGYITMASLKGTNQYIVVGEDSAL